MAVLRVSLVGWLLLAVASVGNAQNDKGTIDKAKLIGTWTFVKTDSKDGPPPGAVVKMQFTKDSRVNVSFTLKDKTEKMTGTYSVNGNKLTTVLKEPDGKETKTDTVTIRVLTDKRLVTTLKVGGKTETSEFKK